MMSKIVTAGVIALCAGIVDATPLSLRISPMGSVSLSLNSAVAVMGGPQTPLSIARVHRTTYRRAHDGYRTCYRPFRHNAYGYDGYYFWYQPYGYGTTYQPYEYGTYQTGNGYGYGMYLPYRFYGYNAYRSYANYCYPYVYRY
jgi:hypothetical protein